MKLFPATYVGTEAACGFGLMPEFVVDHHIGIMLITIGAVGKIHHIGSRTSRWTHIDFQPHNLSLFSEIGVILCQTEKFQMDKAASYTECFQAGFSGSFEIISYLVYNIESDGTMLVDAIHDGDRCNVTSFEEYGSLTVYDSVIGTDLAGHQFFHDIGYRWEIAEEIGQIFLIFQFPGITGTDAAVWFYDDRITDFFDKSFRAGLILHHMKTGSWNSSFFITFLHAGFLLDQRHILWL